METFAAEGGVADHDPPSGVAIDHLRVAAFEIPTDRPESDGTFEWTSTTIVVTEVQAADVVGVGYAYTHAAAAALIDRNLAAVVVGCDPMHIGRCWRLMHDAVRNIGRQGVAGSAIAAVDSALWDLKGHLLGVAVADLLPGVRDRVPIYGSGGFTSYSLGELREQLSRWVECGIRMVKMKIGRRAADDLDRVALAREAIGDDVALFVDANGAYNPKQALQVASALAVHDVRWFEEPVSSDDLDGLRLIREMAPPQMEIAAGEYGYDIFYFRRMLEAGAVDVLQVDATRCAGITGLLKAASLCDAFSVDLSAHTAPALHAHACCGIDRLRHVEYFHDHARIEEMLFDGTLEPINGTLQPARDRPGLGLAFKWQDARPFCVYDGGG